jgi:hypothetical protein
MPSRRLSGTPKKWFGIAPETDFFARAQRLTARLIPSRRLLMSFHGTHRSPTPLCLKSAAAGYADGYIDGSEEAWARINAAIEGRPTPQMEIRKGLLLACKTHCP